MTEHLTKVDFSGHSMLPVLQTGDRLFVEINFQFPFEPGDLVVAKYAEEWLTHRLIQVKDSFFLKGDRSTVWEPLEETQLWGLVIGYERRGKKIIWGRGGQPLKKIFAWLSAQNRLDLNTGIMNRWRRWICLVMMLALCQMENFWLKIINPKSSDNFIF